MLRPASTIDWREYYLAVRQRGNSCTGFARSQALNVFLRLRGAGGSTFCDPYRNYYYSRRKHRLHDLDEGSFIRSAFWAGRFGDVPDYVYPAGSDPIHDAPADFVDLSINLHATAAPIYARGQELVWRICDSLMRRQPVVIGLAIDDAFRQADGPDVIGVPRGSALAIGHAVTVIGCIPQPTGAPNLIIANSWGSRWRQGGTAIIAAEFAALAYDVHYLSRATWDGTQYSS